MGIIYTRTDFSDATENEIFRVQELVDKPVALNRKVGMREVTPVQNLKSITSVIKDFDFFVAEKWEIAGETEGSKNTANIGSITCIEDLKNGKGVFANLGEKWFDEYWMNYGSATMVKDAKTVRITKLKDFLEFKGRTSLFNKMVSKNTKRKT